MGDTAVRAQVHTEDGQCVIRLHGDVTTESEEALHSAYEEAVADRPRTIVFDFTNVGYINSGGIAVLISLVMEALESGYQIAAAGLSDHYTKVFEMVGLSQYMKVRPSA